MGFLEITEKFLQLEEEFRVFSLKIEDEYFWDYVRNNLHFNISGVYYPNLIMGKNTLNPKIIINSLQTIFFSNPFLANKTDILFYSGSLRRKNKEDNKWWEIYCDPIIENLDIPYILLEWGGFGRYTHRKTENIIFREPIEMISVLKKKTKSIKIDLKPSELNQLKIMEKRFNEVFNKKVNLISLIIETLTNIKIYYGLNYKVLKKIKPKLIILVCGYSNDTLALTKAARKLKIPVIELQHGIIGKLHLGYHFPYSKPLGNAFPDYLFVWGQYWKDATNFPISDENIIVSGFPYAEKRLKEYASYSKRKQILFISSFNIGKELSKFAIEVLEKLGDQYEIVYKLHQNERKTWFKNYPWLNHNKNRIKIIDTDNPPLYQLFAESEIQVGVGSTAIYEGVYFDCKTYILPLQGYENLNDLISLKHAKLIENFDYFVNDILNTNKSLKSLKKPDLFASGSIKKIDLELKRILNKIK